MTFVAPAWKASLEATADRAAEILPSGLVKWGLDAEEAVFQAYGIPYQPATVLVAADGTVVDSWAGARGEDELRQAIEALISS